MTHGSQSRSTRKVHKRVGAAFGIGLVIALVTFPVAAEAADAPVGLGTAKTYSVLGGTTVTNTGPSTVSGDIGVNPGSSVAGADQMTIGGATHLADAPSLQAQSDLTTAYNDASGRSPLLSGLSELGGKVLIPGVYSGGALKVNGTLTLTGDASSVFIFQAASSLITGSSSNVKLIGGATQCNVFWQVTSSATLGTDSNMVGTVMALTSISAQTGAAVHGRLLARNGAVTLDSNRIDSKTDCAVRPPVVVTPPPAVTPPPVSTPPVVTAPPVKSSSPLPPKTSATTPAPKLKKLPFTGRNESPLPWLAGGLLVATGLGLTVIARRRRLDADGIE